MTNGAARNDPFSVFAWPVNSTGHVTLLLVDSLNMKLTLQAFSSSGGSYPVEISDDNGAFRMFCHCQAGMTQQMCKHKIALLKGDARMLYDPAQKPLLDQMQRSPAYLAIKQRLTQYELQLTEIEREIAKVKEKEKAIKHDFAYELIHGKPNTGKTYHVQPTANL